jgi:NitT/TauT family transport system permease protein
VKISTTEKRRIYYVAAVLVWIVVWAVLSAFVGEEIFLPSPVSVIKSLLSLIPQPSFWKAVGFTLSRVIAGIVLSSVIASVLAVLSSFSGKLEILLSPLVKAVRSIPVASVIILVLLWVKSRNLSVVISSLVVFPVIYTSVLSGMKNTSPLLLEMASNYSVGRRKRIRYIYIPSVFPYLRTGMRTAVGFAWKSAVAAEVIGLPKNSIGTALYEAKIYLLTSDLFAWTLVIVILSALFEKVTLFLLEEAERRILK